MLPRKLNNTGTFPLYCCRTTYSVNNTSVHCCHGHVTMCSLYTAVEPQSAQYFLLLSTMQTYFGLYAKWPIFCQILTLRSFVKVPQDQISRKSAKCERRRYTWPGRRTDGHEEWNTRSLATCGNAPKAGYLLLSHFTRWFKYDRDWLAIMV